MPRLKTRPRPSAAEHRFTPDKRAGGDPWTGRGICLLCAKVGAPGDAQHPVMDTYAWPEAGQLALNLTPEEPRDHAP